MPTKHILVADDHEGIRKAVCRIILADDRFYPCSEARNGLEAYQFAVREKPDVIVMDLSMPVMNGLDAAKKIKQVLPEVTIVLVSMHSDSMPPDVLAAHGISGKVAKDKTAEQLMPALSSLLKFPAARGIA
jgi:DNA-binding NarL/FixJ family response regulator